MNETLFKNLHPGDRVRHKGGPDLYTVVGNCNGVINLVLHVNATNPTEWELAGQCQYTKPPPDPIDFVFRDKTGLPFRVMPFGEGDPLWLHYLHPDKQWVTLRPIDGDYELAEMRRHALTKEDREKFAHGVPFHR